MEREDRGVRSREAQADRSWLRDGFFDEAGRPGADADEGSPLQPLHTLATRAVGSGGVTCGVLLLSRDRQTARLVAFHAEDRARLASVRERVMPYSMPADEGGLDEVLRTGVSVLHPTADDIAPVQPRTPLLAEHSRLNPSHGQAWIPLRVGEEIVGALVVNRVDPQRRPPLGPDDLRSFEALASEASLLLAQGALERGLRGDVERARIVSSFFAEVATADSAAAVYEALVRHVLRAIHGGVVAYEVTEGGELRIATAEPADSLVARLASTVAERGLRVGEGISGRVAETGEPFFRPRFTPEEMRAYRALLPPDLAAIVGDRLPPASIAVPVRVGGRVAGVLFGSREWDDPEPFTQADHDFVLDLATRAGVALETVIARQATIAALEGELARERAEERYRRLFALADVGIAHYQAICEAGAIADLRVLDINEAGARLSGADRERQLGRTWREMWPGIGRSLFDRYEQAHGTGEIVRFDEEDNPFTGGSYAVALQPMPDDEFLATFTDITARRLAERERIAAVESLARTASALRAILDASPLPVIAVDATGRTTFWSRAAEQLYGWRAEEVLGGLPPHIPGDAQGTIEDERRRIEAMDAPLRLEGNRVTRDGGSLDVVIHMVPLRGDAGEVTGLLTVQEDVTERHRLEADLLQAQKMETVGQLAGGIAHDFNNLLTAIIGFASLARSEATDPTLQAELDAVLGAANRAAGLTQQLLAFSRRQVLQPSVVKASDVVRGTEGILRRLIGEQIDLVVDAPDVGHVLVDRTQLEQVILNLAVNARDAMPDGGRLTITTAALSLGLERGHLELGPGDYVLLSVADTGVGMDEETQAHVFEPFFTTKGVGKGTGLGLATTYGIVRQSGGHIWLYSEPGQGTILKIYLPRVRSGGHAPVAEASAEAGSIATVRVLLVEDDDLLRSLASQVLSTAGVELLEAGDPETALALAAGSEIDVLVTDVIMPGFSGVELARRLRAERPGLRVVLMSGYAEDLAGVEDLPDRRFLAKPFTPDELRRAIQGVM